MLALIVVSLVVPSPTLSARLSIPFFGSFFSGPLFLRNSSPRGNPFPPFWGIMLPPPSLPGTVHGEFPSFGNYLFVPVNARVGARNDYLPKYKNGGGGGWDGVDCLPTVLERAVLCMLCMLPPMVLVRIALCWRCFTGANTGGARGIAVNVTVMGMAVMPVLKDFYQQGEVAASRLVAAVGATVAAATAATVAAVAVAAATAASAAIATTTATISAATAIVATTAATIVTATTAAVEATVTIFVDTATTAALLLTATAPTWVACQLLLILDSAVQRLAGTDCLAAGRAFAVVLASR